VTSTRLNKGFVSALVLANLVSALPVLITSLLLIEISQSFGIEVGIAGQVRSVASTASVVMGLLMGGLSIRYNHKSLYILGLGLLSISALCSYFTPTFIILLAAFALFGLSRTIIRPIGYALMGRFIPLQQRPKVTSYQVVGMASAYLVGSSLVSIIGDWRLMFLVLLLPLALINLVLAMKSIPSTPSDTSSSKEYQQAFKDVLFNKSALACLIAYTLVHMGGNTLVATFSASFFRQTFLIDTAFVSFAFMGASSMTIVGSLMGGRLVNRFGRKPVTVFSALLVGVLSILYVNVTHLWASLVLWFVDGLFVGIVMTAYNSLALEQAPAYRSTMMSLSEVSLFGGVAIGSALGGVLLLAFNYQILGLLGIFVLIGSLLFHFFTIDPTQQAKH
jgi:predicted MFS family arabinose efflux permease